MYSKEMGLSKHPKQKKRHVLRHLRRRSQLSRSHQRLHSPHPQQNVAHFNPPDVFEVVLVKARATRLWRKRTWDVSVAAGRKRGEADADAVGGGSERVRRAPEPLDQLDAVLEVDLERTGGEGDGPRRFVNAGRNKFKTSMNKD